MKIYFEQYDKFESIFVSPKINPSLQKKIDILLDKAKDLLSSHNIDIKVISNTTFYNEMLDPLLKKGSKENDTSELFLRSYKLLEMASKSNSTISKIKPVTKSKNIHMKKEIKGMKIGQFVQHCFRDSFDQNLIKDDEILPGFASAIRVTALLRPMLNISSTFSKRADLFSHFK